jgi:predicted ArsR family transcriptional regulator
VTLTHDHVSTYGAKRRKRSLTERVILESWHMSHGQYPARSVGDIAQRCEISVHALMPHLRVLVERGDVVHSPLDGTYRREAA